MARPFDQVIGKFGRIEIAGRRGGLLHSSFRVALSSTIFAARREMFDRVRRIENRLLVLLHVLVVCERQAFEHREQADVVAEDASGLAAKKLESVRDFSSAASGSSRSKQRRSASQNQTPPNSKG